MSRFIRAAQATILASAVVLGTAGNAKACSCAHETTASVFQSATAVFTGRAIATRRGHRNQSEELNRDFHKLRVRHNRSDQMVTTFHVTESFKGPKAGTALSVVHGTETPSCGIGFAKGKTYTIAAYQNSPGELGTNLCTTFYFNFGGGPHLIDDLRALRDRR
jgi:hypothetical protein